MNIFWLNNIHFAVEFFGVVSLTVAAWLALDAYLLTHEKKSLLKITGFGLFAVWQVLHSLEIVSEGLMLLGAILFLMGLALILLNLLLETPPARPKKFEMIILTIPGIAKLMDSIYLGAGLIAFAIVYITVKRYIKEINKPLKPFFVGFFLLGISFFLGVVSVKGFAPDSWWIAEHAFRFGGFIALTVWLWQYLLPRLKEELMLVMVAITLVISLAVTFTFSALLLNRMQANVSKSLTSEVRTFGWALDRLEAEAETKSVLAALDAGLAGALSAKDFSKIEERARDLRTALAVDMLTVIDADGEVVQRATYRTVRGEMQNDDPAIASALLGRAVGGAAVTGPEGVSVRGTSPIMSSTGTVLGVVQTGFLLDAAFLDAQKKQTGLDMAVYSGDTLYASSIQDQDAGRRLAGIKVTDETVRSEVLGNDTTFTGSAKFLGKPYIASYAPLHDAAGKVIGMVAAAESEADISKTAVATNRLTLFTTLAIMFVMFIPVHFIIRKISEED